MKKTLCIIVALMMAVCVLAGCSSQKKTEATALKIGATGPLTGGAAIYGLACKQAAEIAVEEINALGGLQFELKYEDDAHDAEKAINAYNTLKDWGMQISLGSVTTSPCLATADLTATDHIFALTPSASSPKVIDGYDCQFQMCFTDDNQGSASADYIAEHKLASKVAVIYRNDDDYSKGINTTFEVEAAAKGLEIVYSGTFTDSTSNDFSVQIAEAKDKGAELIFLPIYYTPASLILKQCSDIGYNPVFFGVDGMDGILTLEGFDTSLAEGVLLLTPFSADAADEKTQNFVKKYTERYGETPNQFAADAYDCVYALYQACNAAGIKYDMSASDICTKMMEQFTTMTFDGLTGLNMTWNDQGAVSKAPKAVVIENGVYVGFES